jgi:hypothetical protein
MYCHELLHTHTSYLLENINKGGETSEPTSTFQHPDAVAQKSSYFRNWPVKNQIVSP